MAIRYEAPQPFAPRISEGAGRAEVETRNNPAVYGAMSDTLRSAVAGAERQADRSERAADRRDRSSAANMALAQRQTEADYGNAQRALIADADVENRQSEFEREQQLRVGQAQMEERVRLNEIAARGQVQAMLQQQDLSLQEQQRLARLQTQMGYVANAPGLSDSERRDIMMEMQTGIDPLKRRQETALARQQETRARLYEQEATLMASVDAKNAALDAKSLASRTHYVMDPMIQQQVENELGPISQEEMQQFGERAPQVHMERVRREVMKRGGLLGAMVQTGYDQRGRPSYQELSPPKPQADDSGKLAQAAQKLDMDLMTKEADLQLKLAEAKARASAKGESIDGAAIEASIGEIRKMREGLKAGRPGGGPPPKLGSGGEQPAGVTPPAEASPYTRNAPETQSRQQQSQEKKYQTLRGSIAGRDDLPPDTKNRAQMAVDGMADLMAAHGSYERMPEPVRATYDKYRELIKSLPEAPPPPQAAPAQRPGQPQPTRLPRMGLWGGAPRS